MIMKQLCGLYINNGAYSKNKARSRVGSTVRFSVRVHGHTVQPTLNASGLSMELQAT